MDTPLFRHALVVGKFAPLHHGHQLLIETARRESRSVTVLVYSNPDFPQFPQSIRADWIQVLHPDVQVLKPQGAPPDSADEASHREFVRHYLVDAGIRIDAVFSSEDYGAGFARYLGVAHRMVDRGRRNVPISGTRLRADIHGNRSFVDPLVYSHFVKKIVLLGAESTGKSTLAAALADRLGTCSVAEYGREYWEKKNRILGLEDYVAIAQEHRRLEDQAARRANRYLAVDTNAITTLFYSYYFNGAALPALHTLADDCRQRYDHVYVCGDEIPFEQDGSRDNEQLRTKMQRMILMDLTNRGIPFKIVSGSIACRIEFILDDLEAARLPEAPH